MVRNVGKFKEQAILDMFNDPKFDRARLEANMELLTILMGLVSNHPEQRFSQILRNYGFVRETRPVNPESLESQHVVDWCNEFYAEPQEVLKRVKERLKSDT